MMSTPLDPIVSEFETQDVDESQDCRRQPAASAHVAASTSSLFLFPLRCSPQHPEAAAISQLVTKCNEYIHQKILE